MAWFNASWQYRQKVTIDKDQVDSTESDFPILIDLSDMDADFWANVKSDGGDIRMTQSNGTTQQAVELKNFNQGGETGQVYFKASTLSSATDTDFYIYYGNSGASQPARDTTYGSDNVWDGNFTAVWHLEEDPSGSSPQLVDSTVNANDGTTEGTMTSGDLVSATVGNGIEWDGSDDAADMGFKISSANGTIEYWAKGGLTANDQIMGQNASSDGFTGVGIQIFGGQPTLRIGSGGAAKVQAAATLNTWEQFAWTWSASATEAFKNASSVDTSTGGSPTSNTQNFFLAAFNYSGGTVFEWDGILDEVRISATVRSDGWISTSYNNQNSPATFYSFEAQEAGFSPVLIIWQ
jgi:hypothetical protein